MSVILASSSQIRLQILKNAGIDVVAQPANVDEVMVKQALQAEEAPAIETATVLAEMKAVKISTAYPDQLVIGADQILDLNGTWFDKPADLAAARQNLLELRGKSHRLATACVVAKGGQRIWHYAETPQLTMRDFSEDFLEHYVQTAGDRLLTSVGAYQLESAGVQLFRQVDGNYFSILGLPLLPLMDFLRTHKVIQT